MSISDRNRALVEAKDREALSFSELGRRFDISRTRAKQVYERTREILARAVQDGDTVSTSRLSVRAVNCLKNSGLGNATREQLRIWLSSPTCVLIEVKNVGRKTAAEITEWAALK